MKTIVIFMILIFHMTARAECHTPGPCLIMMEENQENFIPRRVSLLNEKKEVTDQDVPDLLTYAKGFLGTPYLYGGNGPDGIDCSAFVQNVFGEYGINLPRTSREQFKHSSTKEVKLKDLAPMDLLFFSAEGGEIDHVALYLGEGKMIHSSKKEGGVQVTNITFSKFWSSRFKAARRINQTQESL